MKRPIRKRSYLLLEIVISLALISLCLLPLIRPHLKIKQSQASYTKEIDAFPRFQNAFCQVKELLYEQQISWKDLNKGYDTETKDGVPFKITPLKSGKKPSLNSLGLLIAVELRIEQFTQEHVLFVREVSQ